MKKALITLLIILGITSIGHAIMLPQPTRCLFIDFYDFEKVESVYFRADVATERREEIIETIKSAELRVASFWGEKTTNPKFIYCDSEADYLKFGAPFLTPAAAIMHIGSYVVISKEGVDLDIISHELSHTELFERVGIFNRATKIPAWFDEGLAMQVDHRSYYSVDTLRELTNNFQTLPDVTLHNDYQTFGSGSREEVMMNYRAAKYEVQQWYSPEKLEAFISQLNAGKSFDEAY